MGMVVQVTSYVGPTGKVSSFLELRMGMLDLCHSCADLPVGLFSFSFSPQSVFCYYDWVMSVVLSCSSWILASILLLALIP